jgi:gliding motility-associated-like protein
VNNYLQKIYKILLFAGMLRAATSYAQAPVVTLFSPAKGSVGTTVDITGTNFNTNAAANIVFFGATRAKVLSATPTTIKVIVPVGATFEPISVLNTANNLAGYSRYPFHVTFASKGSISPLDFDARVDFLSGKEPTSIAIGDLDGDGKADIAVANRTSNTVSIYTNAAVTGRIDASSFAPKFDIATNFSPSYVEITDVNGDGRPDLTVANNLSNNVSIFENHATPYALNAFSFAPKIDIATETHPYVIKFGDLDADGRPDLAVSYNFIGTTVSLLKNITTGSTISNSNFGPIINMGTGNGYFAVNIADVNNNGKPEILLTSSTQNIVSVFNNISAKNYLTNASFEPKVDFFTAPSPLVVNTGDMDGDGRTDLILSNFGDNFGPIDASGFYISVLLNSTANGSITNNSFSAPQNYTTGRIPQASAVGDLDGDGQLDMICTNYDSESISIFHNRSSAGNLGFDTRVDLPSGVNPQSVKFADIDGDGKIDIIIANNANNTISIYRNNASNTQSITFPALSPIVYGSTDFNAGAISNSNINPLTYTSSNTNVATIGPTGVIHITSAGTTIITVSQAGNAGTDAALPVSQTLVVTRAPLIIEAENQTRAYNASNPTLNASYIGLVNSDDAASVNVNFTLTTTADALSLPGTYPINITGDNLSENYKITYKAGALTINKLQQNLLFPPLADKYLGDEDFLVNATSTSGLPIIFTSSNADIATLSDNTLHINKIGTVSVIATQAGNDIYEPVTVTRSLKILSAQVIIYNTITPNGDGVNDTWNITGLDYEFNSMVSIFNREGGLIFQSRGYPRPFDGTYRSKKLPGGVYYYVVKFNDKRKTLSGSLTLLY